MSDFVVESPVYREELGLWEHQKYFVDMAFRNHKKPYGARFVLADQVGLGDKSGIIRDGKYHNAASV